MRKLVLLACLLLCFSSRAFAMDEYEKLMVRDTLVGVASGLVIGMLADDTGGFFLLGMIGGALFGYYDAEYGLAEHIQREIKRRRQMSAIFPSNEDIHEKNALHCTLLRIDF